MTCWGSKGFIHERSLIGIKPQKCKSHKKQPVELQIHFGTQNTHIQTIVTLTHMLLQPFLRFLFNSLCHVQSFTNICWKSVEKHKMKSHLDWYAPMRKQVFEFQIELVGLQRDLINNSHIRGHLPGKQLTFYLLYCLHWRIWMLTTVDICSLTSFPSCTFSSQRWVLFS